MAAYFFASPVDVEIKLEGEDERKKVDMKTEKEKVITCPVFYDGEGVAGQVRVRKQVATVYSPVRMALTRFLCVFGMARSSRTTE